MEDMRLFIDPQLHYLHKIVIDVELPYYKIYHQYYYG